MNLEVSGYDSITVHGPAKLDELFSSSRFFGISAGVKIIHNPFEDSFKDCCFTVDKIPISSLSNEFKKRKTDQNNQAFNYHFKVNDRTGRLDLNKCIELKVPVGPLLGKLKSGEDIKLEDGRLIKHSDVCAPMLPGEEVLIIDCPSLSYLESLIKNERLNQIINDNKSRLKYVFHFSDIDVILEKEYQEWVNQFSSNIQHIGLNEYCSNLAYLPTHQQMHYFNKFDSELFKGIYFEEKPKQLPFESRIRPGEILETFNLGVKKNSRRFVPISLDTKSLDKDIEEFKGLKEKIEKYKTTVQDLDGKFCYPEITFLGTASAAPGKYRNSSGIFIDLNEKESCILDCGEGTLYSIIRQFGPQKYLEKLCNLKFIFSSHLHADHHIGLVNILLEREQSFNQLNRNPGPLTIFMADAVYDFLKLYDQNFESIRHLFNFEPLPIKGQISVHQEKTKRLGVEEIIIAKVPHCYQSSGVSITMKKEDGENFKIVYSGDTLPCEPLVRIGKDCDLLIHEATFSDHYEDEAHKKRHSTTNQAIDIRNRMNAKFLILTHFSHRYSKLPIKSDKSDNRTGIAFDFLTVNPNNLKKTALFRDILDVLYKEDLEYSNNQIEKRNQKKELLRKYINEQATLTYT